MAMVRKSLAQIRASKPKTNLRKFDATTEKDIRRHMIEDGEDPEHAPCSEDIYTPQVMRTRLSMALELFAHPCRNAAQLGAGPKFDRPRSPLVAYGGRPQSASGARRTCS